MLVEMVPNLIARWSSQKNSLHKKNNSPKALCVTKLIEHK